LRNYGVINTVSVALPKRFVRAVIATIAALVALVAVVLTVFLWSMDHESSGRLEDVNRRPTASAHPNNQPSSTSPSTAPPPTATPSRTPPRSTPGTGPTTTRSVQPAAVVTVHNTGWLSMSKDEMVDLDTGAPTNETYDLQLPTSGTHLVAMNRSALALLPPKAERQVDASACARVSLGSGSIATADLRPGAQVCFRTSSGRPGMLQVTAPDPSEQEVVLAFTFTVWDA
jgi:hypothetical protein